MKPDPGILIRRGTLGDLPGLQRLFSETISSVCSHDYTAEQIAAWQSSAGNTERWNSLMTSQYLLVAHEGTAITGFCSLDNGSCVDLLYIRKDLQRHGIASALYCAIEAEARRQGQPLLTADVSKTARPFFEAQGFTMIAEQTVLIRGVALTNFRMTKPLR